MREIIVAGRRAPYNARMLSTLLAAFACVLAPPNARVVDGNAGAIAAAMSLPLESGPLSSPSLTPPLAAEWTPAPDDFTPGDAALLMSAAPHAALARELFTPLVVECPTRATPGSDCSALTSRLDEAIGSCRVLAPSRGRIAILTRGQSRAGTRHVAVGTIEPAPELLTPDAHASPLLWPARLGIAPSVAIARVHAPPADQPPAAPARRIDRPPRA
jgi:hypothetical protein